MTRQIPAERPLPDKEGVLERVLADSSQEPAWKNWLLPVAAAAAIAVVAGGALTVPSLLKSDDPRPATQTGAANTTPSPTGSQGESAVSVDRGKLSAAEAAAFGAECAKWIGSKDIPGQNFGDAPLDWPGAGAKVDKILHATKVAGRSPKDPADWTVAVKSGDETAVCVGRFPSKDSDGAVRRDYEFSILSRKHRDAFGTSGGSAGVVGSHSTATMSTDRWVVAPSAAQVQRRIVVNGKPGPWYGSAVIDGMGYIRTPKSKPLVPGDKIRIETRLVDAAGQLVGKPMAEAKKIVKLDGFVNLESDQPPR